MLHYHDNLICASLRSLRCKAEHERFGRTAAPSRETIRTSMFQRRRCARPPLLSSRGG